MRNFATALLIATAAASACQAGGHFRARGFGYSYGYPAAAVVAYPAPVLYYAPPVTPLAAAPCGCGVANALSAVPAPAAAVSTATATTTTTATTTQETVVAPQPAVSYAEAAPAPATAYPPPQTLVRAATFTGYLAPRAVVVGRGVSYGVPARDVFAVRQVARHVRGFVASPLSVLTRPAAVVVTPRLARAKVLAAPVVVAPPVSVNATVIRRGLFGRVRSVTNVNVNR